MRTMMGPDVTHIKTVSEALQVQQETRRALRRLNRKRFVSPRGPREHRLDKVHQELKLYNSRLKHRLRHLAFQNLVREQSVERHQ